MADALELLAPAGAREQLTAAVQNGADAVYLGGKAFSARRFAGNFNEEELVRALDYCHERGVRVYVTFNTLLLDRELQAALDYAGFLYKSGADALIVQDMGLIRILRPNFPDLPLHASTQMGVHDENGLRMCERLGLSRAVLARELSLSRIRELNNANSIEIECFAHGALCTAMSGACLFSSLAGGRSGNRGECAQPCRKPYAIGDAEEAGYPLSLADLCMVSHVDELRAAGVTSLKLEGRMKRPEYVAAMTRAYRMAIDGAQETELFRELALMHGIFDRGESTGYFFGADVPANARGQLFSDETLLEGLRETYRGERRRRPVDGRLELIVGKCAALTLVLDGYQTTARGDIVQAAKKTPDTERYIAQISRLGETPFELRDCAIIMPEPAFISVSALNEMRRQAVEALYGALHSKRAAPVAEMPALLQSEKAGTGEVLAVVPDAPRAAAAFLSGADIVALELRRMDVAQKELLQLQSFRTNGKRLLLQLPAADYTGEEQAAWQDIFQSGLVDGGVAQNAGQSHLIEGERIAGYLCNATNAQAVAQLNEIGFDRVLVSLELNKPQLRDLLKQTGTGLYAYGRAQLMQLWHCPYRREGGCRDCEALGGGFLRDDAGRVFPLDPVRMRSGCLTRVRNCAILDLLDVIGDLPQIGCVALEFTYETPEEIAERVIAARGALCGSRPLRLGDTRGHWTRGLQS